MELSKNANVDIVIQYLQADPSNLSRLERMLAYRDLRTEQAYYYNLCDLYDSQFSSFSMAKTPTIVQNAGELTRSFWKDRIISLDKSRRDTHNKALNAMYYFYQTQVRHPELPKLFEGEPPLDPKAIENYLDGRMVVTNTMFDLLNLIENSHRTTQLSNPELQTFGEKMDNFNVKYGVKTSISEDESKEKNGGIEFELKNPNNLNQTENL